MVLFWEGSQVLCQFQAHCLKSHVHKYVQRRMPGMWRVKGVIKEAHFLHRTCDVAEIPI